MNVLKSIGAVLAGILTGAVLSLVSDAIFFPSSGGAKSDGLFLLATAYRTLYGIAGAYVTARLAPSRPMLHAMILGGLGLSVSIAGTVVAWDKGPDFGPKWYPIALCVLALPQTWLGARLRLAQLNTQPAK
jgi:hypothetical protein